MERDQRFGYVVLSVVLMHVLLISAQVNAKPEATVFQAVTVGVFSEIQGWVTATRDGVAAVWSAYAGLRRVHTENIALNRDLSSLRVELQHQRALAQQTRRLERLLALRETVAPSTVGARVIASDATPYFRTLTIDRGVNDAVRPDLAVIGADGVVGRVMHTLSGEAAQIQLLVDRNAAAGALIERTRATGVVLGTDDVSILRMDYVSNLKDVVVGDRVVSSGSNGIYPRGFPIGHVTHVAQGVGLYRVIEVEPAVEFTEIEEVLVIVDPVAEVVEAGGE